MPKKDVPAIDRAAPPFDRLRNIEWLATARRGRRAPAQARHHLYVAREKHNPVSVLVKVTSKPGLVYERDLDNEICSLSTINRELPDSRYFPFVHEHGRLPDGRLYLVTSLFDEFPLATIVSGEHVPGRLVAHLRTAIETASALAEIHALGIFHVDLNPMNVLYRSGKDAPVIRLVDFESSYEQERHALGVPYNPPTTPGYSAPEVSHMAPDARADVYSLGAVLYTLLAGYQWTPGTPIGVRIDADADLDADLKQALLAAVDPAREKRPASVLAFRAALGDYLEAIWPGRRW